MATKTVWMISCQQLHRRSNERTIAPTPTWSMKPAAAPTSDSTVMFRRSVYERFGGWRDSSLPAQDYEWYSRLAAGGARFANLDEPLVRYRLHGNSIKSSQLRGTILTTIDVKRTYWAKDMDAGSRAMLLAEQLLLLLPSWLVLKLFVAVRYGRRT